MNILITICGRKGSKGLRNKNIRQFNGYPLVDYTIAISRKLQQYSVNNIHISVNSDSEDLLKIASKYNFLTTIVRPVYLGQDDTPKISVIKQSLDYMENLNKVQYDVVLDLDITSPFRKLKDIEGILEILLNNRNLDTVFSVVPARRNPYFNMVEESNNKIIKVKQSDFVARQQAPKIYDMNASIYAYRRTSLINKIKRSPFDGECGIYEMKDIGILDIDSEEDFILMSIISKFLFENEYEELYSYVQQCGELHGK
jgi:CMP-N,N'-diacetyllegionaminic acid synthase